MSVLPFDTATLYHEGSGGVTEWFANTEKNIEIYNETGKEIVESTRHPHICRLIRLGIEQLPSVELKMIDR